MSTATETKLPRWDMAPFFPSLDSEEFQAEFKDVVESIKALSDLFSKHDIGSKSDAVVDETAVAVFDEVATSLNQLSERLRTIGAYITAFVTTDSRDAGAQAKLSELQGESVELRKLDTRLRSWIGSLDVDALIKKSEVARDHAFYLHKAKDSALHLMSQPEEDLAAGLSVTGGTAWAKLHGNVTSQLKVAVPKPDGSTETIPMSAVRNLAHNQDAEVRRLAYVAELEGWESVAVPLAAALNSIKGEGNTLNAGRNWSDSLEPSLFINNADRDSLSAMQQACVESFPDFRRYLKAKAKLLGKEALAWWDIFAPVGGESARSWTYPDASEFIVEQFGTYSDRLAGLAARAFKENWIDAEPRDGKRDGAFCMGVKGDVSRVLSNFEPSYDGMSTIAHELGHAYHNINLAERTPLQRATPMALAETASIFCQTIVANAVLNTSEGQEKLDILENSLQDACQVVVDIHSRFIFEKAVYEGRARRELSVVELKEIMIDAQKQTYGDGLDSEALHPYMWAVKGHYYGPVYYNWPYTFGLLFGLGLYAQYQKDPDAFRSGYDDLLSSTGLDDAASLTSRFGFDIRSVDFWRSSLDLVRAEIDEFTKLAG